jgi:hypothetical protein
LGNWPEGAGQELNFPQRSDAADLIRGQQGLSGIQANDACWPRIEDKYVMYPRFKSEWWAYRAAYHTHIRNDLPQGEGLGDEVKNMVEDIEELAKVWETMDIYFDRSKKYIVEALDTTVKFRKYSTGCLNTPLSVSQ